MKSVTTAYSWDDIPIIFPIPTSSPSPSSSSPSDSPKQTVNEKNDICPKKECGRKAITSRRVRGEKNWICSNGHNWSAEIKPQIPENKTENFAELPAGFRITLAKDRENAK